MKNSREKIDGIVLVPEDSERMLNARQLEDYRGFRENLIRWMLNLGKNPEKASGYAYGTARQRSYKIDVLQRWISQRREPAGVTRLQLPEPPATIYR